MFMEIAEVVAKRATCYRANNGAIITQDNNVVSIGYNGPPQGEPHCYGKDCVPHGQTGCVRSIHAEQNAINRCSSSLLRGADLYCTMYPCVSCQRAIVSSGIARVFYRQPYRSDNVFLGFDVLKVYRVTPNGDIINTWTDDIVELNV